VPGAADALFKVPLGWHIALAPVAGRGEVTTKMRPVHPDSSTAATAGGGLLPSGYPCEEVTAARTAAATAGATLASNTLGTM
jgi:hypothetical protein